MNGFIKLALIVGITCIVGVALFVIISHRPKYDTLTHILHVPATNYYSLSGKVAVYCNDELAPNKGSDSSPLLALEYSTDSENWQSFKSADDFAQEIPVHNIGFIITNGQCWVKATPVSLESHGVKIELSFQKLAK